MKIDFRSGVVTYEGSVDEVRDWLHSGGVGIVLDAVREGSRHAVIYSDDGNRVEGVALQRVRNRLLGAYGTPFERGRSTEEDAVRRFLIPDLWLWATVPSLSGTYKAGKTTLVCDLVRALLVPGYRFLDHFDPADLKPDERARGVVVINAETPAEDFEAELARGMTEEAWDNVRVIHLDELGGAQKMNLLSDVVMEEWMHLLAECYECDGSDDVLPLAVIVDGVTAILQRIGLTSEAFGKWYAKFDDLLRACDIPHGLAVGHATMRGDHMMGGTDSSAQQDALWTLSKKVDQSKASRWFAVESRVGGSSMTARRVVLNDDGFPIIRVKHKHEDADGVEEDPITALAHRIADYVKATPGADGQKLTDNVEHGGWKDNILKARSKAITLGLIREERCRPGCSVCTKSHHRRTHYWPA